MDWLEEEKLGSIGGSKLVKYERVLTEVEAEIHGFVPKENFFQLWNEDTRAFFALVEKVFQKMQVSMFSGQGKGQAPVTDKQDVRRFFVEALVDYFIAICKDTKPKDKEYLENTYEGSARQQGEPPSVAAVLLEWIYLSGVLSDKSSDLAVVAGPDGCAIKLYYETNKTLFAIVRLPEEFKNLWDVLVTLNRRGATVDRLNRDSAFAKDAEEIHSLMGDLKAGAINLNPTYTLASVREGWQDVAKKKIIGERQFRGSFRWQDVGRLQERFEENDFMSIPDTQDAYHFVRGTLVRGIADTDKVEWRKKAELFLEALEARVKAEGLRVLNRVGFRRVDLDDSKSGIFLHLLDADRKAVASVSLPKKFLTDLARTLSLPADGDSQKDTKGQAGDGPKDAGVQASMNKVIGTLVQRYGGAKGAAEEFWSYMKNAVLDELSVKDGATFLLAQQKAGDRYMGQDRVSGRLRSYW